MRCNQLFLLHLQITFSPPARPAAAKDLCSASVFLFLYLFVGTNLRQICGVVRSMNVDVKSENCLTFPPETLPWQPVLVG